MSFTSGPLDQAAQRGYRAVGEDVRQGRGGEVRQRCCITLLVPVIAIIALMILAAIAGVQG